LLGSPKVNLEEEEQKEFHAPIESPKAQIDSKNEKLSANADKNSKNRLSASHERKLSVGLSSYY